MSRLVTKPTKWHVRPAKTQISLGICPVWSESSLCTQWVAKDPSFLHADSEDSDQTGRMPRLIWVVAVRACLFVDFVMRRLIYLTFKMELANKILTEEVNCLLYDLRESNSSQKGIFLRLDFPSDWKSVFELNRSIAATTWWKTPRRWRKMPSFDRGMVIIPEITRTRKCASAIFPWGIHIWNFQTLACTIFDERTHGRTTRNQYAPVTSSKLAFLELCLFEKIKMKSDACWGFEIS